MAQPRVREMKPKAVCCPKIALSRLLGQRQLWSYHTSMLTGKGSDPVSSIKFNKWTRHRRVDSKYSRQPKEFSVLSEVKPLNPHGLCHLWSWLTGSYQETEDNGVFGTHMNTMSAYISWISSCHGGIPPFEADTSIGEPVQSQGLLCGKRVSL
jgi:hypothetical protein